MLPLFSSEMCKLTMTCIKLWNPRQNAPCEEAAGQAFELCRRCKRAIYEYTRIRVYARKYDHTRTRALTPRKRRRDDEGLSVNLDSEIMQKRMSGGNAVLF